MFNCFFRSISLIPSIQKVKRIYHSKRNRAALNRLRREKAFARIAGHMSAAFAQWSPRLFGYYSDTANKLNLGWCGVTALGAIFRYVQDGFKMRTQMTDQDREEAEKKQRERITHDLNMYSTISELKALYGVQ